MRVFACLTALSLLSPPAAEAPDPEPPPDPERQAEPPPEGDPFAEDDASASAAKTDARAEALVHEAEGLANGGRCREALPVYHQAYVLAPDEHRIAYEIASCAATLGDCETMRVYLAHFVRYADPAVFPNKIAKAQRVLAGDSAGTCRLPTGGPSSEVLEARVAGGRPAGSVAGSGPDGSGLVGGGIVMAGVGVVAFVAGVAMAGVVVHRTRADVAPTLAVEELEQVRDLTIAASVLGPSGVALVVGGSIMVARGNRPVYASVGPGSLTLRF